MVAEYGAGDAEAKKKNLHILRKMRKELFCETKKKVMIIIRLSSLLPFTLPWIPLSVHLINLLSPTAAIHSSIRKHSHPSTCFSVYRYDLNYCSFLRLLVIRFILCLDLILMQYNRYFYPYSVSLLEGRPLLQQTMYTIKG